MATENFLRRWDQDASEPLHKKLFKNGLLYSVADKSLARPGRKQANASVRMA